jgi:hypothetical protein
LTYRKLFPQAAATRRQIPREYALNNTPSDVTLQIQSMKNTNGLLHIELPGGLMLTGPCLAAPLPPGFAARLSRLSADAVPDHFWMMGNEEGAQRDAAG